MSRLLVLEPMEYYEELGIDAILKKHEIYYPKIFSENLESLILKCDAVVTCLYHSPLSLSSALLAKNLNKRVIYFSDGIEDWANMTNNFFLKKLGLKQHLPAYADIYFLCCQGGMELLTSLGKTTYLYTPKRICNFQPGTLMPNEKTLEPVTEFLISTANTSYFNEFELEQLIDLVKLIQESANRNNYHVIYRIFDGKLIEALGIDPKDNHTSGTFERLLDQVKCLITTPSSIAIPAIAIKTPVALLDYRDSPLLLQCGWRIHKSCNIDSVLNHMLSRDPERINYQSYNIAKSLSHEDINKVLDEIKTHNEEKTDLLIKKHSATSIKAKVTIRLEHFARTILRKTKKHKITRHIINSIKNRS